MNIRLYRSLKNHQLMKEVLSEIMNRVRRWAPFSHRPHNRTSFWRAAGLWKEELSGTHRLHFSVKLHEAVHVPSFYFIMSLILPTHLKLISMLWLVSLIPSKTKCKTTSCSLCVGLFLVKA